MSENRLRVIALFASLCLFFSVLELMIPKPIPFFRLGLANLPLLPALLIVSTPELFLIVLLKVVGQAVVSGTLLSYVFIFSAAGSFAGALVMVVLKGFYGRWITLIGIGTAGALFSNLVQLGVSAILIFGESTRLIAPLFLIMGTVTGLIIGAAAEAFKSNSRWFQELDRSFKVEGDSGGRVETRMHAAREVRASTPGTIRSLHKKEPEGASLPVSRDAVPLLRFIVGVLMIPPFLLHGNMVVKVLQLAVCILASVSAGRKFRPAPGLIVFTAVLGAHLLMPLGEVLFRFFDFPITAGALKAGAGKGLSLVGLVFLSRFAVSKELRIPGLPGKLLYNVLFFFEELTAFRPEKKRRGRGVKDYVRRLLRELDDFLIEKTFLLGEEDRFWPGEAKEGRPSAEKYRPAIIPLIIPSVLLILQWTLFLSA
ncbi:MAG: Gx transporter family protein [Spirochaetia bacterium]